MKIPPEKLVFCNNFHLCCGEGICGACGHVDAEGNLRKMCKCREFSALDLLLPEENGSNETDCPCIKHPFIRDKKSQLALDIFLLEKYNTTKNNFKNTNR